MKTSIFSIIAFISSVCLCAGATSLSGSVSGVQDITVDSIVNSGDTYSVGATGTKSINISKGVTLTIDTNATLNTTAGVYVRGTFDVKSGADVNISTQIVTWDYAHVILDEVVSTSNGDPISLALAGSDVKIDFGVSQTFKYWDVRFNNYTFSFSENVDVVYTGVSFGSVETGELYATKNITLVDFTDSNSIFINAAFATTSELLYEVVADNTLRISGDASGVDYGTATYTFKTDDNTALKIAKVFEGEKLLGFKITTASAAVPEPAEWAMLFGAIALGLAIYRRRK
jgi:hypothetical protein